MAPVMKPVTVTVVGIVIDRKTVPPATVMFAVNVAVGDTVIEVVVGPMTVVSE